MLDYKRIARQITGAYLIKIFESALMFLVFVAITRFLTKYEYGIYSVLSITIILLSTMLGFGLDMFIVRDLTGKSDKVRKKRWSQLFTFACLTTTIAMVVLTLIALAVTTAFNYTGVTIPTILSVFTSGIIVIGAILAAFAYSEKKSPKRMLLEFLFSSSWGIPVLLIAAIYTININLIFGARFLLTALALVIVITHFRSLGVRFYSKVSRKYIRKAVVFSLPTMVWAMGYWAITSSDRYILGVMHSAVAVADYSYVYSLLNTIAILCVGSIGATVYPFVVEAYNQRKLDKSNFLLSGMLKYMLIFIIPALAGFYLMRMEIVTMISGLKYVDAIPIIKYLLAFPLLEVFNVVMLYLLTLRKDTVAIAKVYLIGFLTNISLNIVLVPKYHYYGSSVATVLTYALITFLLHARTKGHVKIDPAFMRLSRIVLSTAIMCIAIAFIQPKQIIAKLATILLGVAVYSASLVATRVFVPDEITFFMSLFRVRKE